MKPYKHIVFATDLSRASRRAARMLGRLWPRLADNLTLLHVVSASDKGSGRQAVPVSEQQVAEKHRSLRDLAEDLPGARTIILRGTPHEQIAEYVNSHDEVDLLVVGGHAPTLLDHIFGHSVAEHVYRDTHCAVLRA